jgi:hypothetical protein
MVKRFSLSNRNYFGELSNKIGMIIANILILTFLLYTIESQNSSFKSKVLFFIENIMYFEINKNILVLRTIFGGTIYV